MSDLYDYLEDEAEDDDYNVISEEEFEAQVMAAAQQLAQQYVSQLEAEQGDGEMTDDDVEEFLLGKISNLESAIGRELTNSELQSAVGSIVNDPQADLKPESFAVDFSDDSQFTDHFVDVLETEAANAEEAEAGEYE